MTRQAAATNMITPGLVGQGARKAAGAGGDVGELPAQRSFGRRVFDDMIGRRGAKVGLAWIGVLAVLAVFAPFIANTHPLLMKTGGKWSSPLLEHLTQTDVTLLVTFFAAVALLFVRTITWPQRLTLQLWVVAVTAVIVFWPALLGRGEQGAPWYWRVVAVLVLGVAALVMTRLDLSFALKGWVVGVMVFVAGLLAVFPVTPPQNVVWTQYREWTRAGKIERAVYAPIRYAPGDRLRDVPGSRLLPPSSEHWMGTENNSADVLSRIIHASRIALAIGFISTSIAVVIGVVVGAVMGYFVGKVDIVGMRLIEIFEAIPTLILLLTFVAFFGRNLYLMMAIIGLVSWTGNARFVRAEFLRLRNQDFVQAATALGLPLRSVLFRHMLPNGIAPVLVSASFGVASAILYESVLSFLGLGLVDEPSWGQLLNQVVGVGSTFKWWLALFPGLMIFLTVYAYNLVGEAVRDALDPKLLKRE
jgi:peptide/nickel transport system permease protein